MNKVTNARTQPNRPGRNNTPGDGEEGPSIRRNNPTVDEEEGNPVIRRPDDNDPGTSTKTTGKGILNAVTKVIGGIGIALLSILIAIKLIPEAAANVYFGFLPEEYRMPALSSCCSSCSSILLVLIGLYIIPQFSS